MSGLGGHTDVFALREPWQARGAAAELGIVLLDRLRQIVEEPDIQHRLELIFLCPASVILSSHWLER